MDSKETSLSNKIEKSLCEKGNLEMLLTLKFCLICILIKSWIFNIAPYTFSLIPKCLVILFFMVPKCPISMLSILIVNPSEKKS